MSDREGWTAEGRRAEAVRRSIETIRNEADRLYGVLLMPNEEAALVAVRDQINRLLVQQHENEYRPPAASR